MEKEEDSKQLSNEVVSEAKKAHKERSHDGKSRLTKKAAIQKMHDMAHRHNIWMGAYPCEHCDWWHVGRYEKIAMSIGLLPRNYVPNSIDFAKEEDRHDIGDALGDMKKKLKQLFPETPTSHWKEHIRTCARCANYFPRGWRLCQKGALLYHNSLAWEVRQIVKERKQRKSR